MTKKQQEEQKETVNDDQKCRVVNKHGWKYDEELEPYIRSLPKVELHVHFDGSLEHSILQSHLSTNGLTCLPEHTILPWDQSKFPVRSLVEEASSITTTESKAAGDTNDAIRITKPSLHSLCTCRGKRSLTEMLKCFEIFVPIVRGNLNLLEALAYDFCKRQWEQNVIYTEVRYSPHYLADDGAMNNASSSSSSSKANGTTTNTGANAVVDAITRGLRKGQDEYNITINQILCCITWRPDWADDVVQIAHERRNDGPCAVVGIDIAAGEEHFDKKQFPHLHEPHVSAFQRAKELNLNVTMHAAEVGSAGNVLDAMDKYNATRIGHGYRVVEDWKLMQEMKRRNVHFESCPTSSVETGGWQYDEDKGKMWEEHPSVIMMKNGLKVGLNSDDPAVFDTSLTFQFRIAATKMKLGREQLFDLVIDSIDAAFIGEEEKVNLREVMRDWEKEYLCEAA
mmetsp:Transcript_2483/g.3743  ORF Transcript_2483/g.3743 Transcript_2483/m.3743 type:complete len:453 (-) Transcript_2483:185-1543(-)